LRDGLGLEVVASLTGPQGRGGQRRHVARVQDRALSGAPGGEQLGGAGLERRVVAVGPTRGGDPLLHVDDQEGGLGGDGWAHAAYMAQAAPRTKTAMLPIGESDRRSCSPMGTIASLDLDAFSGTQGAAGLASARGQPPCGAPR